MDAQQQLADGESTQITVDGLTVILTAEITADGPLVRLRGANCALDGEMPGEYHLAPLSIPPDDAMCLCGHTAHWHSHRGAGDCEHDRDCRCARFHSKLAAV